MALIISISLPENFMDASSANLQLSSSSFKANQTIPAKHSYINENISPQLSWTAGTQGTKSYAIICDDPDAPQATPWVHWVIFNIPATINSLPEGLPNHANLTQGQQGTNDYSKIGWGGPNPPSGTHRYFFKLYALDSLLPELIGKTPNKSELLQAMKKHKILAQAELIGKYSAS